MQSRISPTESGNVDEVGAAMCAWVAEKRNCTLGQEFTEGGGKYRRESARDAKERELSSWKQFKVPSSIKGGSHSKAIADTRWVLPWRVVNGKETAPTRLVAKGYQDPDVGQGNVDFAGRTGRRFPNLPAISPGAIER